jgi:hypothetical protein
MAVKIRLTMSKSDTDSDDDEATVELPAKRVAEMTREQVLLDGDIVILWPENPDDHFDKWDVIKEAQFKNIEWAHGDLHVWFEDEVTISEKVARKTHWQPAEYKHHKCKAHLGITWDMDPESHPVAEIEVEMP